MSLGSGLTEIALTAAGGILIAVVSSWVTVRFTLRRFYSERWWEKKAEAYSSVIEGLHQMKRYYDGSAEAIERGGSFDVLTERRQAYLREMWADGEAKVLRALDIGAFLLSNDAVRALQEYRDQVEASGHYSDILEHSLNASTEISKCLGRLRKIAKRDLRVKRTWWP